MRRRTIAAGGILCLASCVATGESRPVGAKDWMEPAPESSPLPQFPGVRDRSAFRGEESLRPPRAPAEGPVPQEPETRPSRPLPPSRVGERVLERADGRHTKFYPVRAEGGESLAGLIRRYCDLVDPEAVEVLPKADRENTRNLREADWEKAKEKLVDISDWVVVTGFPDEIERVDRFVNLFYASIPQIEIEARVAEITSSDLLDIGSILSIVRQDTANPILFDDFSTNFPNQATSTAGAGASGGLLNLSTIQSESDIAAVLQFLQARQNVDIVSNPRIAVRNGGRAEIVTATEIPYQELTQITPAGSFQATLKYRPVGVKLYVVPYLAGSDTVFLDVEVEVSALTGFTSDPVQNPVFATRTARTDVHVKEGSTFVIGGLLASTVTENDQKIPILGDIPLLGALFRSTFEKKDYTEVLFFITPRALAPVSPVSDLAFPG